jgi:hypothetical protein
MQAPLGTLGKISSGQNQINTGDQYRDLGSEFGGIDNRAQRLGATTGKYSTAGDWDNTGSQIDRGKYSGTGDWRELGRYAGDEMSNERNLMDLAKGRYVGENPYINEMARIAAQQAREGVQAAAGGSGRYGSQMFMGQVGKKVAEAENAMRLAAYNQDMQNWMQASGMVSGEQQAGFNQRLAQTQGLAGSRGADLAGKMQALAGETGARQSEYANQLAAMGQQASALTGRQGAVAGQTGVQGANIANRAGAAGQMAGILNQGQQAQLQAMNMFPQINQQQFLGAQQMIGAGQLSQQQQQNEINALMQKYTATQNAPWMDIGRLGAVLAGGQPYSTTSQYTQAPSPFVQALGVGTGLAGIAGSVMGYGGPMGQGGYYGAPRTY